MIDHSQVSKIKFFLLLFWLIPFGQLCKAILEQNYPQIDNQILQIFQQPKYEILNGFFISIYQISGVYLTGIIVLLALIVLIRLRYWREAAGLAFSTLGILLLVDELLKPLFDRRRPPKPRLVEGLSRESFPSGHAAGNLVLYFYLSLIIALRYPKMTKYIYGLATGLILLIGFSSIYTNAHWATDVLGGYTFGYLWLLISLKVLKSLRPKL